MTQQIAGLDRIGAGGGAERRGVEIGDGGSLQEERRAGREQVDRPDIGGGKRTDRDAGWVIGQRPAGGDDLAVDDEGDARPEHARLVGVRHRGHDRVEWNAIIAERKRDVVERRIGSGLVFGRHLDLYPLRDKDEARGEQRGTGPVGAHQARRGDVQTVRELRQRQPIAGLGLLGTGHNELDAGIERQRRVVGIGQHGCRIETHGHQIRHRAGCHEDGEGRDQQARGWNFHQCAERPLAAGEAECLPVDAIAGDDVGQRRGRRRISEGGVQLGGCRGESVAGRHMHAQSVDRNRHVDGLAVGRLIERRRNRKPRVGLHHLIPDRRETAGDIGCVGGSGVTRRCAGRNQAAGLHGNAKRQRGTGLIGLDAPGRGCRRPRGDAQHRIGIADRDVDAAGVRCGKRCGAHRALSAVLLPKMSWKPSVTVATGGAVLPG